MIQKKYTGQIRKHAKRVLNGLWNVFIDGFFTLLPLCLTIGIFSFSFSLLKNLLSPLQGLGFPYLHLIPHHEFLVVLTLILVAGVFLKSFVLRSMLDFFESVLSKIPLVYPIYNSLKQLVNAFTPSDNPTFKKIVLVEFPRKGISSIGFLTGEFSSQLLPDSKDTIYYSIFIPMTPNPTNGFFIIVAENDFTELNLTTQEAMALVMSGGIIQPERLKKESE